MKAKSGKLDENDIWDLAERIEKESSSAIDNMSRIFDALRAKGLDLSQNGSSSIGNSIKSVTEETANILASHLNAIRLDVSVDRVNIQKIADAVANMLEMSGIAQSQLTQLTTLVSLAQYRNGRLDDMYSWMQSVTKEGGTKHLSCKSEGKSPSLILFYSNILHIFALSFDKTSSLSEELSFLYLFLLPYSWL
jgi:hypothetical protein